jgi:hypothetical protein
MDKYDKDRVVDKNFKGGDNHGTRYYRCNLGMAYGPNAITDCTIRCNLFY